eukprot:m.244535 g.244535  ORF g.244535 m.244535 type:complete len:293 (+) comp40247_c1_seq31:705-1583(+)
MVTPVFKKGDINNPTNYRPISLLSTVSKVLESLVFSQLYNYLENSKLLPDCQYGFRRNRSTQDAVATLTDSLLSAKDSGSCSGAVFLDLSKAFDTVDHTCLLQMMSALGLDTSSVNWFRSYLSCRRQIVVKGSDRSPEYGPLLFILYLRDLPNAVSICKLLLYADDSCLHAAGQSYSEVVNKLQSDLDSVSSWLSNNLLQLNGQKTEFVLFRKHRSTADLSSYTVSVDNVTIRPARFARYLGVCFDDSLSWKQHMNVVVKKVGEKLEFYGFTAMISLSRLGPNLFATLFLLT